MKHSQRILYLLAAILILVVSACRDSQQSQSATQSPVAQQQATATLPAATATVAVMAPPTPTLEPTPTEVVVPPGSFVNPVLQTDFPDPAVLYANGVYYAYATNSAGRNIQLAKSSDLVHWELLTDALPALPTWARPGGSLVWAPEVIEIGGRYVMYYTARDKKSNKQCIGVATSDNPEGKFKDTNENPFVCQATEGGSIDPSPFRDGEKLYLYWKNDGNCCGMATYIYVQEMTPDGLGLVGEAVQLVRNDRSWEGPLIEAPTMFKHEQGYYLFFSANNYRGLDYAVGYATCKAATGPCEDAPENPILKTSLNRPPVIGPGHQTLVQVCDQTWIVYHAWELAGGIMSDRRFMWIDRVTWQDNKPKVQGPTTAPQPMPNLSCQKPAGR